MRRIGRYLGEVVIPKLLVAEEAVPLDVVAAHHRAAPLTQQLRTVLQLLDGEKKDGGLAVPPGPNRPRRTNRTGRRRGIRRTSSSSIRQRRRAGGGGEVGEWDLVGAAAEAGGGICRAAAEAAEYGGRRRRNLAAENGGAEMGRDEAVGRAEPSARPRYRLAFGSTFRPPQVGAELGFSVRTELFFLGFGSFSGSVLRQFSNRTRKLAVIFRFCFQALLEML